MNDNPERFREDILVSEIARRQEASNTGVETDPMNRRAAHAHRSAVQE